MKSDGYFQFGSCILKERVADRFYKGESSFILGEWCYTFKLFINVGVFLHKLIFEVKQNPCYSLLF